LVRLELHQAAEIGYESASELIIQISGIMSE